MPSYDLILDDSTPLIRYSGSWVDASSNFSDSSGYRDRTYHAATSNVLGLTATLSFYGTQVVVYGGKSPRYAGFTVSVDGHESEVSAHADTLTPSQPLFNSTKLEAGTHVVVVKSNGGLFDLDYVVVTAGDGHPETQVSASVIEDGAKNFVWSSGWGVSTDPSYPSGSAKVTNAVGSSYTLTFEGNAVQLFGALYLDHGGYSVAIDNGQAEIFDGQFTQRDSRQYYLTSLYLAGGLGDGSHVVTVKNLGTGNRTYLDLDYAIASSWSSGTSTTSTSTGASGVQSADPSSSTISITKQGISSSAVAGIGIGIGLLVIIALLVAYLVMKRRRHNRAPSKSRESANPVIPSPPSSPRLGPHHGIPTSPGWPSTPPVQMSQHGMNPFAQGVPAAQWSTYFVDRKAARHGPLPQPPLPGYTP